MPKMEDQISARGEEEGERERKREGEEEECKGQRDSVRGVRPIECAVDLLHGRNSHRNNCECPL